MRFLIITISFTAFFFTGHAFAEQPLDLTAYQPTKTNTPIVIDGILDEQCWQSARKVNGFKNIPHTDRDVCQQTTVMIAYDDNNLYIAFICDENSPEKMLKRYSIDESDVWLDDCLEVFIASNYYQCMMANQYYSFISNSRAAKTDLAGRNRDWHGKWNIAAKTNEKNWTAEFAIPFKTINVDIKKVDLLGISLGRERQIEPKEATIWPLGGSFHSPIGILLFTSYKEYFDNHIKQVFFKEQIETLEKLKNQAQSIETGHFQKQCDDAIATLNNKRKLFFENITPTAEDFREFMRTLLDCYNTTEQLKHDINFHASIYELKKMQMEKQSY